MQKHSISVCLELTITSNHRYSYRFSSPALDQSGLWIIADFNLLSLTLIGIIKSSFIFCITTSYLKQVRAIRQIINRYCYLITEINKVLGCEGH